MDDPSGENSAAKDSILMATDRLAAAAQQMVDQATTVATQASRKIGENEFTAGAMLRSLAQLANVAVVGGLRLAETALGERPDRPSDGMLVLNHEMASIVQQMVSSARGVAEEASSEIAQHPYNPNAWVRSMTKLADIAMIGGTELAETAVIGPARYADTRFISDPFTVERASRRRELTIAGDLTRPGTVEAVPRQRITFEPRTLAPGATEFRMVVNEAGLPSGVYTGAVQVGDETEPVPVAIRL
jgi:hypothetical protein